MQKDWLSEDFWGKGITTEAVNCLTRHIFENTDPSRIVARVFSNNIGSIRVLEKAGYKQEGYFKSAIVKEGKILDQLQYSILQYALE
jgi:RimJ/RimL family protein N-acetyltransferase